MKVTCMLSIHYAILLLSIIINDRQEISGNAIDLLSSYDKNVILTSIDQQISNKSNKCIGINNNDQLNTDKFCHLYNENYLLDVYNSTSDISSLANRLQNTINYLNQNLNVNEKVEINTQSIAITVEKVSSNNLTNKHLTQTNGAEVRFPQLNINANITINLMTLLSSSIVSLTLHDQLGEEIKIENSTDLFEIIIPHRSPTLMPSMTRQNVQTYPSTKSLFKYYYINLTHQENLGISLHIEFQPEHVNLSYLFLIRFSAKPNLKKNLFDDKKLICSKGKKYTYFLDNHRISHHQWAIFGIRELKECTEENLDIPVEFTSDYLLRMYTSGCYYLDHNNQWQSNGLLVGSKTNKLQTQCYSTHLTTFAGGFIVLPDPIDYNARMDFDNMKTIYITLIVLAVLYCSAMIYSYFKDKHDAQMLMVIPLLDNNPRDTYLYQLVVFTGMRTNAGTKSKVHLIISGDDDETNVRSLTADRPILQRGHTDSFIMAVPRSLGQLNYLRVWHDNSGFDSDASWYLKYILVRDLQTMETNYFICEKWLAVEKDDGAIERTIPAAGELQKRELKHLLSKNAYRSMADNHLWFSIFAYHLPSANRFTRMQRCTCCFVILFMSILMNILYYPYREDIEMDELDQFGLTIGPFHISLQEISTSVMSELIVFFPSLFLVALFRRSKARQPRKISPVGEAIQTIRTENYTPILNSSKSPTNKFLLPWWCIILAYILSFLMVATSITFILFRCAEYGDARTRQWLGSILTSFCASVLLTQPLKVLSLAILFMCLCRRRSQVDAFIEQEDPIEDFTVSREDAHRKYPAKSILAKTRLDPYRAKRERAALKKLREIRLKEVKAWFILRELLFLLFFLAVLFAISFANRDVESAHQMVHYLRHEYLKLDYFYQYRYRLHEKKKTFIFENIRTIEEYWEWMENIFIPRYNQTVWKNKTDRTRMRAIGNPILRQLRVKNDSCPKKALRGKMDINDCNLPYTWYNEAKTPFGYNLNTSVGAKYYAAFNYTSAEDRTLIYSTAYATYMPGGFIHEIRSSEINQVKSGLHYLRDHHWIDRYTRAIFLTFGIYNVDTNLFVYCSLLFEQLPITHELILRASFQPFKLVQIYTGADLIYCCIYLILILYYMYVEIRTIFEMGKKYIKNFWSYINWAIIFCSWFAVVIHILREQQITKMSKKLRSTDKNISLQFFSYLDSVLVYLLGFCCFFGTIKILRLLRFNRRLSLLHLTLIRCARQVFGFLIMFSFVFIAFTSLFYILFHTQIEKYSTWFTSAFTCFQMVAFDFSTVNQLRQVNAFIAGLCLVLFIFLAVFLLSNMFISIIVDTFNLIRQEQLKQTNEVEMIEFIKTKVKQYLGKRTEERELEKIKHPVLAFPEKVDQLIKTLDKINKEKDH